MRKTALVVLLCFSAACSSRHNLRPDELRKLDGYSPSHIVEAPLVHAEENGVRVLRTHLLAPGIVRLQDTSGEWFDFDPDTHLRIASAAGPLGDSELLAARVDAQAFAGELDDGTHLEVPLAAIEHVETSKFHVGRTIALAASLGAVGSLVVGSLLIGLLLKPNQGHIYF